MSQIKLLHSGGNGVSIVAPDSNPASDRTLKLPSDADGTIATTATAGKILQVVQTVKRSKQTIQSQTLTDITGLSVTITPSSSSNKILINYSVMIYGGSGGAYYTVRIVRGSDNTIFIGDENSSATNQSRGTFGHLLSSYARAESVNINFLDSPNTTSATTYKLQGHTPYSSSYSIGINSSPLNDNYSYMTNGVSSITAMEVAA